MIQERIRHIALLVPQSSHYLREACLGLAGYARQRPHWHVWRAHVRSRAELVKLLPDGVDGAIAAVSGRDGVEACLDGLSKEGVPVVNMVAGAHRPGWVTVAPDNEEVGRLVVRYLADRGVKRFGYAGMRSADDAARRRGFERAAAEAGCPCEAIAVRDIFSPTTREDEVNRLAEWMGRLAAPVGLMAFNDAIGRGLTDAAHRAGLHVPDDVAVIAVDNWEVECEFSRPRLASVDLGLRHVGYRAAEVLDRLVRGEPAPDACVLLPPRGVVERPSGDVLAVADPIVRRAVRLIRDGVGEALSVEDVLDAVNVSRTWIDAAFREHLGHTVNEEIWRTRVAAALGLLVETDWPLADVAARSGFSSLAHLSRTIRKRTGMTPTDYRRRHRDAPASSVL